MKRIVLFLCIFVVFVSQTYGATEELKSKNSQSEDLVQLSEWLEVLQAGLNDLTGIDTIWVGGGSARAILDHLYFGKPLEMRDLDIFVVADQEVTEEFVEKIGSHIESEEFGYFSRKDLRSRPRVPLDKPVLTRNHYVAGFGLFWLRANGEILDLSVYHSRAELDLNGIFDIDTMMIPLRYPSSLKEFVQKAEEFPYPVLVANGDVYDRYDGYDKWLTGEVNIVNWLDIEADPILKVMRVVRTLFKNHRSSFTAEETENFRHLLKNAPVDNPLQMTRSLLKILEDKEALAELDVLQKIGLFDHWLEVFKDFDFKTVDLEEAPVLSYGRGDRKALGRLYHLIHALPTEQHRLETLYTLMAPFDLPSLATWLHEELCQEERIFEEGLELSTDHVRKICFSTVLSLEEKRDLFQKEIEQNWVLRRGIITGVFNPVHRGHTELFQEALTEMVLDELCVIPMDGSPHREQPLCWEDRYAMLKLVEDEMEGVKVLRPEYRKLIKKGETYLLNTLVKEDPHVDWVRIMGTDMLQNYRELGEHEREVCPQVLVIQRGDTPFYPIESDKNRIYFKKHLPNPTSHQKSHQAKSVRKLAREGKDTSEFVPSYIAEYIKTHRLYQKENALHCVTTNEGKFHSVQKLFPVCEQVPIDLPLLHLENPEDSVKDKLQRATALGKFPLLVIEQFIKIKALSNHFIPLSDFTLQSLGVENLAHLMALHNTYEATLLTIIAYAEDDHTVQVHQEKLKGEIAPEELRHASYFDVHRHFHCQEKGIPLERVLKKLKHEKIGLMTGVFNPIHLGHLEALEYAKAELGLDEIFIIPTPATHHNEQPIAWEQRMEMAALALQNQENSHVIPWSYEHLLQKGTGRAIDDLMINYPNATFWHIMGSDSFERFAEKGLLEKLPSRYRIAVVERSGFPVTTTHPAVTLLTPSTHDTQERASSIIRHNLQEGKSISNLVPPAVEQYIFDNDLYIEATEIAA